METHKKLKPYFSQSCDRLVEWIENLLSEDETKGDISNEDEPDSYEYWSKLRDSQLHNMTPTNKKCKTAAKEKQKSPKLSKKLFNVSNFYSNKI